MLELTREQRVKVEENINLVGKVIHDCVHRLDPGCIYDYEDLYQIGCIGLCKAAQTDKAGHSSAFSTYAYRLIRNEIYTQLEYATRRGRELATDPGELPCITLEDDALEEREKPASPLWNCWTELRPAPAGLLQRAVRRSVCWRRGTAIGRSANCLVCLSTTLPHG